jgi:hypothetical protein
MKTRGPKNGPLLSAYIEIPGDQDRNQTEIRRMTRCTVNIQE